MKKQVLLQQYSEWLEDPEGLLLNPYDDGRTHADLVKEFKRWRKKQK